MAVLAKEPEESSYGSVNQAQEPKKSSQISDPFCFSPMMIMIRLISPISKLIKMLLLIVVKNGKKPIFFFNMFFYLLPTFF